MCKCVCVFVHVSNCACHVSLYSLFTAAQVRDGARGVEDRDLVVFDGFIDRCV